MIRALDRFYYRHPRIAFAIVILVAFICMAIADQIGHSDGAVGRPQVASSRSAT